MVNFTDLFSQVRGIATQIGDFGDFFESAIGIIETVHKILPGNRAVDIEARKLLSDLFDALNAAKRTNIAVHERLVILDRELNKRHEFEQDLAEYAITQTNRGATVYERRDPDQNYGSHYYACPKCVADQKISFLQPRSEGPECYYCPNCDKTYEAELPDYGHDQGSSSYDFDPTSP